MLAISAAALLSATTDLARPSVPAAERLSASPNIWITHDFLAPTTIAHLLKMVPKDEAAYMPCIGQVDDFESKRCAMLPARNDPIVEAVLDKFASHYDVDIKRLREAGLPIIRYLPGAPPVGKHGDEDRHGTVPNATLVVYLTPSTGSGQTIFPEAGVQVTPRPGSVLSFQNVDDSGAPHPQAKHWVSAVPKDAPRDRLILQIPIAIEKTVEGLTHRYAYAEHVSGGKKPGQHEAMHGNADQKAAFAAAVAAGMSIAVALMAAKQGTFSADGKSGLEETAKETGKFADTDFADDTAKSLPFAPK